VIAGMDTEKNLITITAQDSSKLRERKMLHTSAKKSLAVSFFAQNNSPTTTSIVYRTTGTDNRKTGGTNLIHIRGTVPWNTLYRYHYPGQIPVDTYRKEKNKTN
jgi:hypothetical protein